MTNDLISRPAAILKMRVNVAEAATLKATDPVYIGFLKAFEKLFVSELDDALAVSAVEVVRCKNCEAYQPTEGGKPLCIVHQIAVCADDYCSYGKRRESEVSE